MWWENLLYTLLGGILGLVPLFVQQLLRKKGNFTIFAKCFYVAESCANMNSGSFLVPIMLDCVNEKGVDIVVRDIKLYAYNKGEKCLTFTDVQNTKSSKTNEKEVYGIEGNYGFNVSPHSIISCKLFFMLHLQSNVNYDELVLGYKDEKNKEHLFTYANIEKSWYNQENKVPHDWIKLVEKVG